MVLVENLCLKTKTRNLEFVPQTRGQSAPAPSRLRSRSRRPPSCPGVSLQSGEPSPSSSLTLGSWLWSSGTASSGDSPLNTWREITSSRSRERWRSTGNCWVTRSGTSPSPPLFYERTTGRGWWSPRWKNLKKRSSRQWRLKAGMEVRTRRRWSGRFLALCFTPSSWYPPSDMGIKLPRLSGAK